MKTKILSILALLLMTVTQGAWAQKTLTVFDGTAGNQYIPMYGYDFNGFTKSECIIPGDDLKDMEGSTITAITFYAKTVDSGHNNWGTAKQKVFLKEVSGTTLSSFSGITTDAVVVFDGLLPMPTTSTDGYTITFSQGYTYNGGNLLIGVYNYERGSYNNVEWYGNNNQSNRVSAYGNSSSNLESVGLEPQSFLPKTTFTYETPSPQGSWNYDYTGAVQSFTAPYEGTYTLEAWGAQGGNWVKTDRSPGVGGKGGYASGTVTLAKNQTIYIYVGGQGATTENQQSGGAGGWNGGGTGGNSVSSEGNYVGAGGGGGASHVSLSNAQVIGTDVTTLSGTNYLIVAGGGGGAVTWTATAGAGGGTEGGAGATTGGTSLSPWYNSALSTGRNGYNAVDYSSFSAEGTGGGGGGYLGGNAGTVTSGTSNQDCGGCGGSSNYNSTYVSNFTTTSDVREGAGKVTITFLSGEGTEASPYLIASTTDWNNLVSAVNAGETYSGNYFKMTANVGTVSTWMTGTFSGTFDGDGKTLTVGYSTSARYCAPFGTLGGTVKNLRVAGTLSSTAKNFGGIAAQVTSGKTATIENCRVSTSFTSTLSGDNSSGSFVGVVWNGGTLNITGCAFTGSLTGSGNAFGGFLGYKEGEGTCSMTDCLFAPASVTISTEYAGTFSRPSAPTITNCYFTRTFGTAQGMQARTIAAGDYVSSLSVTKGNATATYTVSGITVYSGGIDFYDGSTTTFYGGSGQTVSLALTAETRTGYQFKQYAASQGTLSGQTTNTPTLTMPAANSTANDVVTISAKYDPTYNATFADGIDNDGWTISPSSATAGQTVTISYTGSRTITSVSAVKKPFGLSTFSFETPARGESSNLTFTGASTEKPVWFTGTVDTHNTTGTVVYNHSAVGSYDYLSFNGIQIYAGNWDVPGKLYITGGLGTKADPFVLSFDEGSPDMELTVTSAGEKSWTITMPTSDVEIQVLMPYTVTFGDDNSTLTEVSGGAGVSLPSRSVIGSYTFAGWSETNVTEETTTAPTIIATGEYHPTSDITLYPVYTRTESSVSEVVDVLNRELTGVTKNNTSYSEWSGKTATSLAVYKGQSAGGNDAIQLRTNNSNSGIVTTASGGKVKKVSISWESHTNDNQKVDVYGKNSAYSAASDLYNSGTQGTKLGSIVKGTSTELTISGDYEYIGLRSNNGAVYLSEVDITWSSGSFTTYYTSLPRVSLSYTVTFGDDNDNDDWMIDPEQQIEGGTVTVSYTGANKVKSVTVKANPSTLAGLKAAINDASDLTDLNTKVLGKYVTATGDIQSTSEGAVGIIAYISKTAVDNSFADSRIFVIATENASNSAAQAPSNAAETTYNSTSDLNGYAVTNAWQALDGYNASKAGWNYSASRPDGASHWFVPSYGQWMLGGWNDGNNRPCSLMRSMMEGSGQYYAVSTAINTEGNNTGYCVDGSWWGMGTIQRTHAIRVRAAFVY